MLNRNNKGPRPLLHNSIPHKCQMSNIPSDHNPDTLQFCTGLADDPAAVKETKVGADKSIIMIQTIITS